jgi:hypothetical protein
MPSRNSRKLNPSANTSFHVYNRGIDRRLIFRDDADRREFLQCFRRYLAPGSFVDSSGRPYRRLRGSVTVLAYCLMPNHFHFVVHQCEPGGMERLFRSAMTGYVKYFNARHGRRGRLFTGEYLAVAAHDPRQLQNAIAYVHSNHHDGPGYQFCSHRAYLGSRDADWIDVERGLAVFGDATRYRRFMSLVRSGIEQPQTAPV